MLTVWGRRNSGNVQKVMWAIGELGLAYERRDVGGSFGQLDTPEFRTMNPNSKVPVIQDGGHCLYESNTVVRYLSSAYGYGDLFPDDLKVRSQADLWMDWQLSTIDRQLGPLFMATVRTEPYARDPDQISHLARQLGESFKVLDDHLAENPYIAGDQFTMGDIPLGAAVFRYFYLDILRPDLPHVSRWYDNLCNRRAYREHVMIPIGHTPKEWLALEQEGAISL